ncbi:2-oxoglutarate and iron-dependent oxygenase JMJD4-like [Stegodyphus dumicola]|uniref:2-oxoglutarate and iron-dependent oxygenase JMJD4-like n=1 Tax=Stegodyphus dumicola TaxID=202533 RepID=UPI0015B1CC1B|nr:2-oxoglutarate and iron-dependent oxygenase JMJD4-like [Stegodyphus dumicola]
MGPKGTWTPLHADVFGSYSWSANVCGRKKWLLFPPGTEELLLDDTKKIPYSVNEKELQHLCIPHLNVVQETGEIIFVPSGWYHQVHNLEDTISINHNWFNGCNILHIWDCLHLAATDVEKEISDCRIYDDWQEQWQMLLKVHHGMNYASFLQVLESILSSRLTQLKTEDLTSINWHHVFDIVSVRNVCLKMRTVELPLEVKEQVHVLESKIKSFLTECSEQGNFEQQNVFNNL